MSLLDTIKGAREEAAEAGTLPVAKKASNAATEEPETSSTTGFSKRSAARAKPARELAGTIHKGEEQMTKAEKQAAKQAKREEEDLLLDAKKIVLDQQEEYRRTQRIWWILLIAAVVLSVASYILIRVLQGTENPSETATNLSMALMVTAYVCIIGAFIFDLVKVRPMRNAANDKVLGMSKRRLRQIVADEKAEKEAKKAAKGKK